MGTRNKKKGKSRRGDLFAQARRHFEKRDFKQALKDAKVCYRQDATHEHRALLERAYCARARELDHMGMPQEARNVIDGLLELGVTEPLVREQLAGLSMTLGVQSKKAVPGVEDLSPEVRARLLNEMADRAIVKMVPEASVTADLRAGARAVRAALDAVERGEDAQATELLKDIPRNSPFSDWKLFVRGLTAYYRENRDEMVANWDRLAEGRAAREMAATLSSLADAAENASRNSVVPAVGRLERPLLGTSVLFRLAGIQESLAADDVENVVEILREARSDFKRLDRPLRDRLAEVLAGWAIRRGDDSLLRALERYLDPPTVDPHWNRAAALLNEHPDYDDCEAIENCWLRYVERDLPTIAAFSEDERQIVESLVWRRLGQIFVREAAYEQEEDEFGILPPGIVDADADEPTEEVIELRQRAVDHYHKSIERNPALTEAYRELAEAQEDWRQEEQAAETRDRLLTQVPDDIDALLDAGTYNLIHGDPLRGREYVLRAYSLRPLDEDVARQAWMAQQRAARHFAKIGNWDEGRAAFEAAAKLDPRNERRGQLLARQAVFEFKAKQTGRAEELAQEAQATSPEPTPILLLITAEAARYGIPRATREKFQAELDKALKKRCTSSTAGQMSEVMASYVFSDVNYVGRSKHVKAVQDYVKRSSRVKFDAEDLQKVCDFLQVTEQKSLLSKMVVKGRKKFPKHPYFQLQAGMQEMAKGPLRCNRRYAAECFERVVKLTESSDAKKAKAWAETAKEQLTFLHEVGIPSRPFGRGPTASDPSMTYDDFSEIMAQMAKRMGIDLEDLMGDEDMDKGRK